MAKKTVVVEAALRENFKMESRLGKHTLYVDQPEALGGTDSGPNPLEYFLLSLAGCISATARIVAKQKRINLRSMTLHVEGTIDMDVLLGKNRDKRAGFPGINVEAYIDADISAEEKTNFLKEVGERCPVSSTIENATSVSLRRKDGGL